ncbi:MAG TPA: hypothetical protein VHE30_11740 [Polyangiaceae bacterium]|nr:hypothetical protein [Polyangiaceae bacterium]
MTTCSEWARVAVAIVLITACERPREAPGHLRAPVPGGDAGTLAKPGKGSGVVDVDVSWAPGSPVPAAAVVWLRDQAFRNTSDETAPVDRHFATAMSREGHRVSFPGVPAGSYDVLMPREHALPTQVVVKEGERVHADLRAWSSVRIPQDVLLLDLGGKAWELSHVVGFGRRNPPPCIDETRVVTGANLAGMARELWENFGKHRSQVDPKRDVLLVKNPSFLLPSPDLAEVRRLERPTLDGPVPLFVVQVLDLRESDPSNLQAATRADPAHGTHCPR